MRLRVRGAVRCGFRYTNLRQMNLKRGLLRSWIVVSVLWWGLCVLVAHGLPTPGYMPLVVSPPLVLFALGWAAVWAVSGFKR
jgi:hypothetical protein